MDNIEISTSGDFVTIGAGIKAKKLIDSLWKKSKQTVTGVCECVGLAAVALGGGHGMLQGYYGLLSEQMLSLRMILANGTAIDVSKEEHADLFWAMQGAGHNFGVVTELKYKIYNIDFVNKKDIWSYEVFTFPATKENVKRVYSVAQSNLETQPPGGFQYGLILTTPVTGPEPVILHHVVWNGPLSTIKELSQGFHDLEPMNVLSEEGTYLDIPRFMQVNNDGTVCKAQDLMPGAGVLRFPVDVRDYNIDALGEATQKFTDVLVKDKEFAGSFFMLEQYSTHQVRKVDPKSSAFPNRDDRLLLLVHLYDFLHSGGN